MSKAAENKTHTRMLGDVIGRYCGHGNQIKFEELAERAKCSGSLLSQLKAGNGAIGFDLAMDVIKELPEEAQGEFFASMGLTGLHRIDGVAACFEDAHVECTRTVAYYAEAYRDRIVDHRERRLLVRDFFPKLMAVVSRCMRHAT
jgi:hypothetical protein